MFALLKKEKDESGWRWESSERSRIRAWKWRNIGLRKMRKSDLVEFKCHLSEIARTVESERLGLEGRREGDREWDAGREWTDGMPPLLPRTPLLLCHEFYLPRASSRLLCVSPRSVRTELQRDAAAFSGSSYGTKADARHLVGVRSTSVYQCLREFCDSSLEYLFIVKFSTHRDWER